MFLCLWLDRIKVAVPTEMSQRRCKWVSLIPARRAALAFLLPPVVLLLLLPAQRAAFALRPPVVSLLLLARAAVVFLEPFSFQLLFWSI